MSEQRKVTVQKQQSPKYWVLLGVFLIIVIAFVMMSEFLSQTISDFNELGLFGFNFLPTINVRAILLRLSSLFIAFGVLILTIGILQVKIVSFGNHTLGKRKINLGIGFIACFSFAYVGIGILLPLAV